MEAQPTQPTSQHKEQAGLTLWFTGLSGAGKSTLARAVRDELMRLGFVTQLLDADQVRRQLCPDLGFSRGDREENVRRMAYVAGLLTSSNVVTLVAAMSPFRASRAAARAAIGAFLEVYVDAPLALCQDRDPVGLYRRFNTGEIRGVSGLDEPYESPEQPEVHCHTASETVEECASRVVQAAVGYLRRDNA